MPRSVVPIAVWLLLAGSGSAWASEPSRHSGRVHSLIPTDAVLIIEEVGVQGEEIIEVDVSDAEVVRVWRDPEKPWEWLERPTRVQRLSVGTFVVVIGRSREPGFVDADRIEVPKAESK